MVKKKNKKNGNLQWWYIVAGIVFIATLIVLLIRVPELPVEINPWDPYIGEADAPINIVIFHDYQCGFCKKFFNEIYPRLYEDRIKTHEVRLTVKNFPVSGLEAGAMAEASMCAVDQRMYWKYHEALINTDKGSDNAITNIELVSLAEELGMDKEMFKSCLDEKIHFEEVDSVLFYGQNILGLEATPVIYVNGMRIDGVVPYEEFDAILNRFRT